MQRTRKQTNSPRGRTHLGVASPPVMRSPIRGAGQAGNVFGPLADDLATDETELVDDVSPPHDDAGGGGSGGGATAAALQANPGGIFLPQLHPNYSQFLKKHINSPSRGLHFPK